MTRDAAARHWLFALSAAVLLHTALLVSLESTFEPRRGPGAAEPAGVRLRLSGRIESTPAPTPPATSAREPPSPSAAEIPSRPARPAPEAPPAPSAAPRQPATAANPATEQALRPDATERFEREDRPKPDLTASIESATGPDAAPPSHAGASADLAAEAPATSQGSAAPAAGSNTEGVSEAYRQLLWSQIQGCLRYPRRARRRGVSGAARVSLEIAPDGALERAALATSSGSTILDRDAVETVERCAPYPPLPSQLQPDSGRFRIPVEYELDELR